MHSQSRPVTQTERYAETSMHRVIGLIGIICSVGFLAAASWGAIPYISQPAWYSNFVFWILLILALIGGLLVGYVGYRAFRNPSKSHVEVSGYLSALIFVSFTRVVFVERIEGFPEKILVSIFSAVLIFAAFYLILRKCKYENGA